MNLVLWVAQVVLALLSVSGGAFQIFKFDELKEGVAAMRELPQGLWAFFGAFGILAGVCLVVPAVTKVMPVLTPIAAAGMAVHSVVLTALYLYFGDRAPIGFTIAMTIMAVFVAYGRFVAEPI